MRYHIKFMYSEDDGECVINLFKEQLIERFVNPYLNGENLIVNGSIIDKKQLKKVKICETEDLINDLVKAIEEYNSKLTGLDAMFSGDPTWLAIDRTQEVTNDFLIKIPKASIDIPSIVVNKEDYINIDRISELK